MNLRSAIVLGFLLVVTVSQAVATGPIVRPADGDGNRNDCVYGNDLYPAIVLMDYFHGNEHLKYHVYPPDYLDCSCDVGFTALDVGMYMEFTDSNYPVDFVAFADVERATWDEVRQCWVPGEIVCESGPWNVQIGVGGGVTVVVPVIGSLVDAEKSTVVAPSVAPSAWKACRSVDHW